MVKGLSQEAHNENILCTCLLKTWIGSLDAQKRAHYCVWGWILWVRVNARLSNVSGCQNKYTIVAVYNTFFAARQNWYSYMDTISILEIGLVFISSCVHCKGTKLIPESYNPAKQKLYCISFISLCCGVSTPYHLRLEYTAYNSPLRSIKLLSAKSRSKRSYCKISTILRFYVMIAI